MAKACTRLTAGVESSGSGTTVNTASVSPSASSAVIVTVVAFNGANMAASGLGLTWSTKINGFQYATDHRIWVFVGYGSPSAGVIALTYDDGTFLGWVVDNVTGSVSSTPTNANTATGSGTGTAALATLGAFANAANGAWAYCVGQDAVNHTPGTGWTEVAQRTGLFDFEDSTIFRDSNDTTADITLSASAAWGMVALEIADTAGEGGGSTSKMLMLLGVG